jgi:hypothetical protein
VPRKGIPPQSFHILYDSSPERIQVNVSHQLQQIGIFLAQDGFITILEEMPMPPITMIEKNGISG